MILAMWAAFGVDEEAGLRYFPPGHRVARHRRRLTEGEAFRGQDTTLAGFADMLQDWSSYVVELEGLLELSDDEVLAFVREFMVGRLSGLETSIESALIFTILDGRVRRVRPFLERGAALAAAGLDPRHSRARWTPAPWTTDGSASCCAARPRLPPAMPAPVVRPEYGPTCPSCWARASAPAARPAHRRADRRRGAGRGGAGRGDRPRRQADVVRAPRGSGVQPQLPQRRRARGGQGRRDRAPRAAARDLFLAS